MTTFLFREVFLASIYQQPSKNGSSGESPSLPLSFRPVSYSEFRGKKIWLTTIVLFRIFIRIVLWHIADTFKAFLRYEFSQNTHYKSSTARFTKNVKRGWRIGLQLGMRKLSLENAVLDRQTLYEIRTDTPADFTVLW